MPKVIPFPQQILPSTRRPGNHAPAQVVEMSRPIASDYIRLIPQVEENIVRMWRRGVKIRQIAAMYGGRGIGVAQVEAIVWLAAHSDGQGPTRAAAVAA